MALRNLEQITADVVANNNLTRTDVLDVLANEQESTRDEYLAALTTFLEGLPAEIRDYRISEQSKTLKEKVLADIDSYLE